jgi:cell pole-organizing protein PopZ
MEEIIASISRVIAEDKPSGNRHTSNLPGGKVAPGHPEGSDILELTQVVEEDGSVHRIASPAAADIAPSAEPVIADGSRTAGATTLLDLQGHAKSEPTLDAVRERIVSTATSGAAAAAFAQLGVLPRDRRRQGELPLSGAERTLGEIVREMLRPMLQSWLDEHLPDIVERLVREEIARVVGESGLR